MSKILRAFQKHEQVIRKIVAKYRPNPDDIEELTQETFLKGFAVELEARIHKPDHLLMRIAKNLAIKAAAKKAVIKAESLEDFEGSSVYLDDRQSNQEDALDARRKLFVMSQALANLDPELGRALLMRRVDGLKYKQIAMRMNVSVSTAERRVAAAMVECFIYLRKHGYDPADFSAVPMNEDKVGKPRPIVTMFTK